MEIYLSYGAAAVAFAALAGLGTHFHFQSRKQAARMVDLYKKLETSEASARRAKEQFLHAQEETANLRGALERERRSREENAVGFRVTARKQVFSTAVACLAAGIFAGGAVSGFLVYAYSEVAHLRQSIDLQVRARMGEERAAMLGGELARFKEENQKLHYGLFAARETEAVTLAKMEVLLDNLSDKKVNPKLLLDIEALRSSLRPQDSGEVADLRLAQAAVKI